MAVDPNQLIAQGSGLITLDQQYVLADILNVALRNMLLVGKSDQAQVVTTINANLYQLAVEYYGDVDYWTVIANANYLNDAQLTGTFTLLIPPKPTTDPSGIMNPTFSFVPDNVP